MICSYCRIVIGAPPDGVGACDPCHGEWLRRADHNSCVACDGAYAAGGALCAGCAGLDRPEWRGYPPGGPA